MHKLRLTVINGIPCKFVEFHKSYLGVLGSKGVKIENAEGEEIRVTSINMQETNLRRKIWMIICKIYDL